MFRDKLVPICNDLEATTAFKDRVKRINNTRHRLTHPHVVWNICINKGERLEAESLLRMELWGRVLEIPLFYIQQKTQEGEKVTCKVASESQRWP